MGVEPICKQNFSETVQRLGPGVVKHEEVLVALGLVPTVRPDRSIFDINEHVAIDLI